ncbi:hypothetical protein [Bartonella sp. LJL80]
MTDKNDYIISLEPLQFKYRDNEETDWLYVPHSYRIATNDRYGADKDEERFYSVFIVESPSSPWGDEGSKEFLSRHSTREQAEAAANQHFHDCITGWIKSIERKPTVSGDSLKGGA